MDSTTTLALGTGTATTTTLGRTTNTATNINGTTVGITGTTSITLSGATTINSTLTNNTIDSSTTAINVSLWTSNLTGIANILTGTTRSATTNIQNTGASANEINIGGDNSITRVKGLRVTNIDSIAVGAMSIGATNTNAINLNNKAVSGLTMAANQFITMGTNTALPAVNQIGYIYNTTPNGSGFVDNAALTTGVAQEYGTIASVPAGVYMVSANLNMQQVALTTITSVIITLSATGNTPYIDRKAFVNGATATNNYSISGIFSRGATLTAVACSMTVSFTGTAPKMSMDSFKFNIVRIA